MLFEIPISILHSKFGGMFGTVDQGLTLYQINSAHLLIICIKKCEDQILYSANVF